MKAKILFVSLMVCGILFVNRVFAEDETRNVSSFTEISLRVPGKLFLEQGDKQSVEIVAKTSDLKEIVTEVRNGKLIIRFDKENYFWNSFNPGKIEIYITVPEINELSVSGSGDIIAEDEIKARSMDLAVSGSGDINLEELVAEHVKAAVSGSGDIVINSGGNADDFSISISGSGDVKAEGFQAKDVTVKISGSGDCTVNSNGTLNVRVAGSGDVLYRGNPQIDSSVAGSGKVRKM